MNCSVKYTVVPGRPRSPPRCVHHVSTSPRAMLRPRPVPPVARVRRRRPGRSGQRCGQILGGNASRCRQPAAAPTSCGLSRQAHGAPAGVVAQGLFSSSTGPAAAVGVGADAGKSVARSLQPYPLRSAEEATCCSTFCVVSTRARLELERQLSGIDQREQAQVLHQAVEQPTSSFRSDTSGRT